jgi:ornithine cyclodeaminase/alanine dehydrogenase-like protein (mu-crystallin family)
MARAIVLGHAEVAEALPMEDCIEAMGSILAAHARGEVHQPLRSVMMPPNSNGFLGLMPSHRGGDNPVFALKTVAIFPGNPARGLDAHQGTVTLFDGETGVPTAILDASAITSIRTAAVSGLATRLLSRGNSTELAIIGSGTQAGAHLQAMLAVRDLARVRVYSPNREHAERLAQIDTGGVPVHVADSAQDAVFEADLIVTATNSREPVLERDWIDPGTHINAVGASSPNARELDTATVAASSLFPDSRESLGAEAGEFQLALRENAIPGPEFVKAELGEVAAGMHPGRVSADEITLFRSLGLGIEDLAAAELAVENARARGTGMEVEL